MAVYLDANIFSEKGIFPSLEIATIAALAREKGLTLCAPDLVLDEVLARYERSVLAAQTKLTSAIRDAASYWQIDDIHLPDVHKLRCNRETQILTLVTPVATRPEDAMDALQREAWRKRPAREGRGARDSCIWNTIRRHHMSSAEPSYFISRNTADFADTSGSDWHEELRNEIANIICPMTYCSTPGKFFAEVGEAVEYQISSSTLRKDSVVAAVTKYIEERQLVYSAIDAGYDPSNAAMISLAGPINVQNVLINNTHAYSVGAVTAIVSWTKWELDCLVSVLRRFPTGGYGQFLKRVQGSCDFQLLLRIGPDSKMPSSEVSAHKSSSLSAR